MSGTLVPSSGSSNFAQQGSVDWVALSNSSVQFSVAVLARLSKAGVDAYTLRFGQVICCNFALEPRAQELVTEAIRKVKKYPSYGDLMWFGFGIKDIVTDLADTEEGLTLVALCAALSTTYDSLFLPRSSENSVSSAKHLNLSPLLCDNGRRRWSYVQAYCHPPIL